MSALDEVVGQLLGVIKDAEIRVGIDAIDWKTQGGESSPSKAPKEGGESLPSKAPKDAFSSSGGNDAENEDDDDTKSPLIDDATNVTESLLEIAICYNLKTPENCYNLKTPENRADAC